MSTVYRFSAEQELATLRQWLWHEHISHYYRQDGDAQLILLINDAQKGLATSLVERWRRDELPVLSSAQSAQGMLAPAQWQGIKRAVREQPVVIAMIVFSIAVFWLCSVQANAVFDALSMLSPSARLSVGDSPHLGMTLVSVLCLQEWWRLITPIFLHFSLTHLVFNMMWLWVLGRHIERDKGSLYCAGVMLLWGVFSNLAQLLYEGADFGGMSGVVYGVIGYLWVEQRTGCRRFIVLPQWLFVMFIVWALWGILDSTLVPYDSWRSNMANASHFGGLCAGCLTALASSVWHRVIRRQCSTH